MAVTKSRSRDAATPSSAIHIHQSNTNETNQTNRTSISRRSRASMTRASTNAFILENTLLREVEDRQVLYDEVTENYSTHGLAVIFILHIKPRHNMGTGTGAGSSAGSSAGTSASAAAGTSAAAMNFSSFKTLDTTQTGNTLASTTSKHIDPLEELKIIQSARTLFESNGLFDDTDQAKRKGGNGKFTLVKYDDKRIFCMCDDEITTMNKMIAAKNLIRDHFANHETAVVDMSGGCELGRIFEMVNDYYGDPINVASKLGDDTAQSGELLVSFGGKEEVYIKKFRNKADFIKGSVEVSKVQIDYYFMEEKEPKIGFMGRICCMAGSSASGGGGGGGVARGGVSGGTVRGAVKPRSAPTIPETAVPKEQARYDLSGEKDLVTGVHIYDENGQNMLQTSPSNSNNIEQSIEVQNLERPETPPGAEWEEIVMLQSDLSGFTRLTKKYGILHFMTLILNCRKVFNTHLEEYGGEIIKYDGDNIICKFCSNEEIYDANATQRAIQYVLAVRADLDKYNSGREEDFQIRAKIGMAKGSVLVTDDGDIVGDAWEDCCELSEEMAKVGEILITEEIKGDLEQLDVQFNCEFETRVPEVEEGENAIPHYNLTLKS